MWRCKKKKNLKENFFLDFQLAHFCSMWNHQRHYFKYSRFFFFFLVGGWWRRKKFMNKMKISSGGSVFFASKCDVKIYSLMICGKWNQIQFQSVSKYAEIMCVCTHLSSERFPIKNLCKKMMIYWAECESMGRVVMKMEVCGIISKFNNLKLFKLKF